MTETLGTVVEIAAWLELEPGLKLQVFAQGVQGPLFFGRTGAIRR